MLKLPAHWFHSEQLAALYCQLVGTRAGKPLGPGELQDLWCSTRGWRRVDLMSAWCPGTDKRIFHQKKGKDLQIQGQSLQFSGSPGSEAWPGLLHFARWQWFQSKLIWCAKGGEGKADWEWLTVARKEYLGSWWDLLEVTYRSAGVLPQGRAAPVTALQDGA